MTKYAEELVERAEMAAIFIDDAVAVAAMRLAAEYADSDWAGSAQVIGMLGAILATEDLEARKLVYIFLRETGIDLFNQHEEE